MRKILSFLICFFAVAALSAQSMQTMVAFTAVGNSDNDMDGPEWTRFDSVVVTNVTSGWSQTFNYPDTVIIINSATSIDDYTNSDFYLQLGATYDGVTEIVLTHPEAGNVRCELFDITGRQIAATEKMIAAGTHILSVEMATAQIYFVKVSSQNHTATIKLIGTGSGNQNSIVYSYQRSGQCTSRATKGDVQYPANFNDEFECTGYLTLFGRTYTGDGRFIFDGQTQIVQLGFNLCKYNGWDRTNSTFTDTRDGHVYYMRSYGCQTWMTENLSYVNQNYFDPVSDGVEEDNTDYYHYYYYAYNYPNKTYLSNIDDQDWNEIYINGVLYPWNTAVSAHYVDDMEGSNLNPSGIQGICPDGWHLPSDNEWKELEYFIGMSESDVLSENTATYRGVGFGPKLAGWRSAWSNGDLNSAENDDIWNMYGFTAYPAGYRCTISLEFRQHGVATYWWTATRDETYEDIYAYYRNLNAFGKGIGIGSEQISDGHSVRCVMDE